MDDKFHKDSASTSSGQSQNLVQIDAKPEVHSRIVIKKLAEKIFNSHLNKSCYQYKSENKTRFSNFLK